MRWRKTSRPRVWVGNLLGVTVTDPAGFAAIVPWPGDAGLFLDGTGQFSRPVTAASVSAVGYWTPITNGDRPPNSAAMPKLRQIDLAWPMCR